MNLEEPWDGKGGVTGWVGAAAVDTLGMVVVMVERFFRFHLSFDLWINFTKFRLRPGVYFLALGLSL